MVEINNQRKGIPHLLAAWRTQWTSRKPEIM